MKKIFRQPTGEYCTLSKRCSRKKVNTSGKCLSYSSFCDKAIEWFPISFFLPQKMFPFRMRKGCIFLHSSSQDGNSWCFEDAECASEKCFVSSCTFLEAGIDNINSGRLDKKIWSSLADYTCVMALAVTGNRAHENKGPVCYKHMHQFHYQNDWSTHYMGGSEKWGRSFLCTSSSIYLGAPPRRAYAPHIYRGHSDNHRIDRNRDSYFKYIAFL